MTYMDVGNAVKAGAIYCLSHGGEEGELMYAVHCSLVTRSSFAASWGPRSAAGRPPWMAEVPILKEHLSTDIEVGIARMCLSG